MRYKILKTIKSKKCFYIFEIGFFNPFKQHDPGEIIPEVNLLPKIGIKINNVSGKVSFLGIGFGFLNFVFNFGVHNFAVVERKW